jgi:hypothetical protein
MMEKISLTVCVKNKAVLHRVREEKNNLYKIEEIKTKWTGHVKE